VVVGVAPELDGDDMRPVGAGLEETAVEDVESTRVHRHELVDVYEPKDHPHRTRHCIASRIAEASRLNEVDQSPASLDVALAGGLDVLDPVDVGTVGHREDEVVTSPEGVDRRPVHTP
jgi:hypothetical protein